MMCGLQIRFHLCEGLPVLKTRMLKTSLIMRSWIVEEGYEWRCCSANEVLCSKPEAEMDGEKPGMFDTCLTITIRESSGPSKSIPQYAELLNESQKRFP